MTDMHNTSTSSAVPHDDPRLVTARQRLDRLDGYLRSDPRNNTMLIDAFETALSCQEWERAEFHLRHAQSLQTDGLAWQLREGDFWLAQERYDDAQSVLEALRNTATLHQVSQMWCCTTWPSLTCAVAGPTSASNALRQHLRLRHRRAQALQARQQSPNVHSSRSGYAHCIMTTSSIGL